MTVVPDLVVGGRPPRNPFRAERLPLIAKLCRIGFHRYRGKWSKRLGKRPGRLLFDVAYHGLRLGGRGAMTLDLPAGPKRLDFDARKIHFRGVYGQSQDGHEPEVAAILETLLAGAGPADAFFDVGANWGYFAFYAATIPGFAGPIHAFEPIAETYADLEDLTQQAGLAGRIRRHQLALSDTDGEGAMTFDPTNTGLARLAAPAAAGPGARRVTRARLDGLGLPAPRVMKVDVENHETEMFQGARAVLTRERPFVVFENWIAKHDPQATLRPLRYLESLGYALYLPGWRFTDAAGGDDRPAARAPKPHRGGSLALVRFPAEARFQFAEQVNALACHADRAEELTRAFSAAATGR